MKVIRKLKELKVIQDSLEGTTERKKWNRSLALVSGLLSLIITLVSLSLIFLWIFNSLVLQVTFTMRLTAAVSSLLWTSQVVNLLKLLVHMVHREGSCVVHHIFLVNSLVGDTYAEILMAFFFTLVVFPVQATDHAMISYFNESFNKRAYFFVIPSLFSVILYIRICLLMLTAMFTDVFVQSSLELDQKMKDIVKEVPQTDLLSEQTVSKAILENALNKSEISSSGSVKNEKLRTKSCDTSFMTRDKPVVLSGIQPSISPVCNACSDRSSVQSRSTMTSSESVGDASDLMMENPVKGTSSRSIVSGEVTSLASGEAFDRSLKARSKEHKDLPPNEPVFGLQLPPRDFKTEEKIGSDQDMDQAVGKKVLDLEQKYVDNKSQESTQIVSEVPVKGLNLKPIEVLVKTLEEPPKDFVKESKPEAEKDSDDDEVQELIPEEDPAPKKEDFI